MIAHQLALVLVLSPLWQTIGNIDCPPLVEDMTLSLQLLGQSLDSTSSSMFSGMILLSLLSSVFSTGTVVLLVLLVRFFVGSREVESRGKADHHVSTLIKHGRTTCPTGDLMGKGSGSGREGMDVAMGTAHQLSTPPDTWAYENVPVEAKPLGAIVETNLILLEDGCELERGSWPSVSHQVKWNFFAYHVIADSHHNDKPSQRGDRQKTRKQLVVRDATSPATKVTYSDHTNNYIAISSPNHPNSVHTRKVVGSTTLASLPPSY